MAAARQPPRRVAGRWRSPLGLGRGRVSWSAAALLAAMAADGGAEVAEPKALALIDVPSLICTTPLSSLTHVEHNLPMLTGNPREPHILSFFRTSPKGVQVRFKLLDAELYPIIQEENVTLQDVSSLDTGRRLFQGPPDYVGSNCEDFFLSDGRAPVEIPDTFSEAREVFLGMCQRELADVGTCEAATERAFEGYPNDEAAVESDGKLCGRLFKQALPFLPEGHHHFPRRLKSGWGAGSGAAVSGSVHTSRATGGRGVGNYGYSTSTMGGVYPNGYATTGYGYAGRMGSMRTTPVVAVVVGASMWGGGYRWSRTTTGCYGDRCRSPNNGGEDCRDTSNNNSYCEYELNETEDLTRDDLMQLAFKPSDYQQPFRLTVYSVSGEAFWSSRICPPETWTGENDTSWTLPTHQDLFAAISPVETMTYTEEDSPWLWSVFVLLIPVTCVACLCWRRHRRRMLPSLQLAKKREQMLKEATTRTSLVAPPMRGDLLLHGDVDKLEGRLTAQYKLSFSSSFVFQGTATEVATGMQQDVLGVVDWNQGGSDALEQDGSDIMWRESRKDGTMYYEAAGTIFQLPGKTGFRVEAIALHEGQQPYENTMTLMGNFGVVEGSVVLVPGSVAPTVMGISPLDKNQFDSNVQDEQP